MPVKNTWIVEPLGDQAVLASCSSEELARQLARAIRQLDWPAVLDVVVAYHTLAVHLDTRQLPVSQAIKELKLIKPVSGKQEPKLHLIPCCYQLGEDLPAVAELLKLTGEEVVRLHTETTFTVHAIGFSPGFPYLGWLPGPLQGVPRRAVPRLRVPAGSVALVGRQSAVYPQETPGGWALIGRTPMPLVDVQAGYFPLEVGDQVRFESIDEAVYELMLMEGKDIA